MGQSEEEDDDTHYCIKCHATIQGLDCYVAHRKGKCKPQGEVRAHDFFSSLNLQSSSKVGNIWPSPGHTGGKWTPCEEEEQEEEEVRIQCEEVGAPPPNHTGGKWKPSEVDQNVPSTSQGNSDVPPPDHTRGKWGPAERPWGQLRKGLYWCGPCNRRLSSKVVYERHIRSELHFKRTNQWPQTEPPKASRRVRVRTKAILSSGLKIINRRYTRSSETVRRRRGGPLICEACGCRVWPQLIGKHLVSHYHYRHRQPGCEEFILQNMDSVVKQAPFQCALCKFYTNTVKDFIDHWNSDMHHDNDVKLEGSYWCDMCKRSCEDTTSMGYHLQSDTHGEVVSVINRSVPIIIRKMVTLHCDVCSEGFRYNAELRRHALSWSHPQNTSTASDSYQEVVSCGECDYRCFSLLSYQKHAKMKHDAEIYFCRRCDLRFETPEEARNHRKQTSHKDAGDFSLKKCLHCYNEFLGMSALRDHLTREHPEYRHRCPKCGAEFILKQELSQHAKAGVCDPSASCGGQYACDQCPYATNLESELLLHNILHGQPDTHSDSYPCLYCGRSFKKDVLKNHVKTHTSEKPHTCSVCGSSYRRRDSLMSHMARMHSKTAADGSRCRICYVECSSIKHLNRHMERHQQNNKNIVCQLCSATFSNRTNLRTHMQRHLGKKFPCAEEGCIFKARSASELKIHMRTHGLAREFPCPECTYSAKTSGQLAKHKKSLHSLNQLLQCPHCDFTTKNSTHLRRHTNLHTGQKPYNCPHCSYSCSLLENLRKHVINSKLHPGKTLYECAECDMKTNFAKDLKAHLVTVHGKDPGDAAAHVSNIYQPVPQVTRLVPVKPNKRKRRIEGDIDVIEEEQLPTLTSVALTPHDEEVIFIEVGEGLEGVLFQASDPSFNLESYSTDRE